MDIIVTDDFEDVSEVGRDVLEPYARGVRYFKHLNFPDGSDFTGALLEDVTFEDCWLFAGIFKGANLRAGQFLRCCLKCAIFDEADLENSKFRECAIESITLDKAKTWGASFKQNYAYGATWEFDEPPDSTTPFPIAPLGPK